MAEVTDSLFQGFDATLFRRAIRGAMLMGLPNATSERVTFRWTADKDYDIEDPGGQPYDWTDTPTSTDAPADLVPSEASALAAVEFVSRASLSGGTAVGDFETPRVVITMLDVDYEDIFSNGRMADQVVLDGADYVVDFVEPPVGLFGVTVYQIHASTDSES